ncbi:MAG: YHYH protein [Candidatus Sumerlaeaceae bacterium]|nr:YHYH protein [Candidatus Sumerlaeaceae bacterium]
MRNHIAVAVVAVVAALGAERAQAHLTGDPAHDNMTTEPQHKATITIEGDKRVVKSNGWPDHKPGQFPNDHNPNTLAPVDYTFKIPLKPVVADRTTRANGWWLGVALNGVPFEPGTGETWNNDPSSGWRYEAHTGFLDLGLDENNAHVQPPGAYHYHALPVGLVRRLGDDGKRMLLVGWAADGFPMYTSFGYADPKNTSSPLRKMRSSYRLKQGTRPSGPGGKYDGTFTQDFEYVKGLGDLDECNGRTGVTPEYPQGIYHYYITDDFPFLPRLWRGTPDASFRKNEMGGPPGGGPPGARPQGMQGTNRPGAGRGPAARRQAGGAAGPTATGNLPMPPVIAVLDTNGDGTIDSGELAKATEGLRKLDENGDGKLSPEEYHPPRPGAPGPESMGGQQGGPPTGGGARPIRPRMPPEPDGF